MRKRGAQDHELDASADLRQRRYFARYSLLTVLLFGPLLISFAFVRNLYPFAASTMMMAGGDLEHGATYYVLRGETVAGETIWLPPIDLSNALSGRIWGLVSATVENKSFSIRYPHPANQALVQAGNVTPSARLPELLRAWGSIYNDRLPADSNQRLRAMRLDAYRWEGRTYANYDRFVQSWRVEL